MAGRIWDAAKLGAAILELHQKGVDLSPSAIQKSHPALFSSARSRSHFGSWRAAVEAAGLDYEVVKRRRPCWSREEIITQMRRQAACGEDLLCPQFKLRHRSLYLAACAQRYFGSWRRAIEAAGLGYEVLREQRVWTRKRILRTIRQLALEGRSLGWASVEQHSPGLYRAARRKENFGSWHQALITAGVTATGSRRGRRPAGEKPAPPAPVKPS